MMETIKSEQEMQAFGERLGARLAGGSVVELIGDVGAGKTTLTRGIARGLGVEEAVQSPSFTLSRVYDASAQRQLVHYDFYRLSDAGILADELADTMGRSDTITIIEWADIVEGVLPDDRIEISITSPSETERAVTVRGISV
jgi:tRNA threonylcarbamoyladenosine biosynthesis protein TsaE